MQTYSGAGIRVQVCSGEQTRSSWKGSLKITVIKFPQILKPGRKNPLRWRRADEAEMWEN